MDSTYPEQMRQRLALLATRCTWVVDHLDSETVLLAETELRDRVVQWLTTEHPRAFTQQGDHVTCHLTGVVVDVGPQGVQPMVAVAALATEDFLLMLPAEADAQGQVSYRLMSGALLFPNGRPGSASGPAHVGVGAALAPEGALRPVAGDEHRVVAHGPQALRDAVDQMLVIALGEIGAADAAGEQHIANKRAVHLGRIKHHMPRRVARAMPHGQRVFA